MSNALEWLFHAITSIQWLVVIQTLSSVMTAIIAFAALKNWQRQDKAKREAEFLDALIENCHTFIVEMRAPITLLEIIKMGMSAYAPTWEKGEHEDIATQGAINYIEKRGKDDGKRLQEALYLTRPTVIKLQTLTVKGQVFNFDEYTKCQNAVKLFTWHFDRIEALMAFVYSSQWNWDNAEVLAHLKNLIAIDPEEIRKNIQDNNRVFIEFAKETYKRIYS